MILTLMLATAASAQLPIQSIDGVTPKQSVFRAATRNKPLVIRSAEQAAEHFAEDDLNSLKKSVDFDKQLVLVFAWRGSGQDRLKYSVAESYPEQISFKYLPGRTRDLRPHIYVYALRSNVRWSVR
jgi:hypothetical protein